MKLEMRKYTREDEAKWDNFVLSALNGTFLHSRAFFNHNPRNAEDDCSYIFYKKSTIAAVIPCALYGTGENTTLHSHPRCTYGGFVVSTQIGMEEAVEMVGKLKDEAVSMGVKRIIVRNPFRIFNSSLCDESDYAMWYHGFSLKSREVEIAIDLRHSLEYLRKNYENGTKYNVKKALKHVETAESEDFATFWSILEQGLSEKHGKAPVHTLQDMQRLITLTGQDKVKLFGGFAEGKMVCGVLVFLFGGRAIHAQYIGSDSNWQDLRPVNAVIDYIIEWGHKNGYAYFNLGMANEEEGRKINFGLYHFKESFGGRGVLRETMMLTLP